VRRQALFEPPKFSSFLFNHFRKSENPASGTKGLVCGLHYSSAKGGCHENQNECEGWPASSLNNSVKCRGKRKRDYQIQRGKESSHEDQDQREGRHPAVCVIVNRHATRVRSSEHQPQDSPKAALARRLSSFPYFSECRFIWVPTLVAAVLRMILSGSDCGSDAATNWDGCRAASPPRCSFRCSVASPSAPLVSSDP
jgi:hypothetical protein